jgi:hypothetical protein
MFLAVFAHLMLFVKLISLSDLKLSENLGNLMECSFLVFQNNILNHVSVFFGLLLGLCVFPASVVVLLHNVFSM